jgi:glycosyltransferase involved in cell wall biosynthesis
MPGEPLRVLVIPSSDYLGHPFPQRHNQLFERIHDGKELEVHVVRFNIFGRPKLSSKCIIHEIPLEIKTSNTGFYYLANASSYTVEILKIIKRESIDVVFAGNLLPPLTYMLVRNLVDMKTPLVFDLQDYYPMSAAGYLADVNSMTGVVLTGFFEAMNRYLVRNASVVTVPGVALKMYSRRAGARRVCIVHNGISEHFLAKHDGKEVRKRLGYSEKDIVVGYIGSIEFWLDMESLIKAVSMAKTRGLPVKLLLVGKHLQTSYPLKVEKWLRDYGIDDVTTWLNFIPHSEVPRYNAAIDVATIPFDVENPTAYYAAPNKLWEYLSQGAIVSSTPIPEVLAYRHIGKVYIVKNPEDYVKAIEEAGKQRDRNVDPLPEEILKNRLWGNSAEKLKKMLKSFVPIK